MRSGYSVKQSFVIKLLLVGLCITALTACEKKTTSFQGSASGEDGERVGFVDLVTLFEGYDKIKAYDSELEVVGNAKQEERNEMVVDIRKIKDEISLLSDVGKAGRQSDLSGLIQELDAFDNAVRRDLGGKRNDLLAEVLEDIQEVVDDFADSNKYDFIFSSRSLLFRKDQYNVTKPVLRELNRRYDQTVTA